MKKLWKKPSKTQRKITSTKKKEQAEDAFNEKKDALTDSIGDALNGVPQTDTPLIDLPQADLNTDVVPDPDCGHSNPQKYNKKSKTFTCACGYRIFDVMYETFKELYEPSYVDYTWLHLHFIEVWANGITEDDYYIKAYADYKGEIPALIEQGKLDKYQNDPVNETAKNECTCIKIGEYFNYCIVIENENRSIQIYCPVCDAYIPGEDVEYNTFMQYASSGIEAGLYQEEDIETLYALNKAQEIGPQMISLLHAIGNTGQIKDTSNDADVTDYLEKFKDYYDLSFAIIENDEQILNCMTKDEFEEFLLGKDGATFLKWGNTAEDIVSVVQTLASLYKLGVITEKYDNSVESAQDATVALLDVVSHIMDFAPDEIPMSLLYEKQLEALSESCKDYFKALENYQNFIGFQESFIEGTSVMFRESVFSASQYETLIQVFNEGGNRDVRDYWSQPHMPSLNTILKRLGTANEEGISVYDRLTSKEQLLVTKYVEYRIHYEFETYTGITLECYYDLMQRNTNKNDAPWEKNIDIHGYETFSAT